MKKITIEFVATQSPKSTNAPHEESTQVLTHERGQRPLRVKAQAGAQISVVVQELEQQQEGVGQGGKVKKLRALPRGKNLVITLDGEDQPLLEILDFDATPGASMGVLEWSASPVAMQAEVQASLTSALTDLQQPASDTAEHGVAQESGQGLGTWLGDHWLMASLGVAVAGVAAAKSGASAAPVPPTSLVQGSIAAGPVLANSGLKVKVFKADGKTPLGEVTVQDDGSFSLDVGSYTGVVIARLVNKDGANDYLDEATGQPRDLTMQLMAIGVVGGAGSKLKLNINPLTTLAARMAGLAEDGTGEIAKATDVKKYNDLVAKAFGLTDATGKLLDLTGTAPNLSNDDTLGVTNPLGAFLAALSGMDVNNSGNSNNTLTELLGGINPDGTLTSSIKEKLLLGAVAAAPLGGEDMLSSVATFLQLPVPPHIKGFTVTDNISDNGTTLGKAGETLSFEVTLSEAVTSTAGLTAVFTVNGVDVTATAAAVSGSNVITFTGASVPATGDGTAISLKSLVADSSGTITGDATHQSLVAPTAGAITYAGYTVDNTLPTITTTYSVAENTASDTTPKSVKLAATEGATWSALSGADSAAFTLAADGTLSFIAATNFEAINSYAVTVTGTDAAGNASTRNVTINLTDVNEAPVVIATAISDVPAVTNTAYTTSNPLFDIHSYFTDPENAALSYSLAAGAPSWLHIDPSSGKLYGTAPATAAADLAVTVNVSDGVNTVSKAFQIDVVSAPSLSTKLVDISDFDPTSKLVLQSTEDVNWTPGGTYTFTIANQANAGTKTGFKPIASATAEATKNDQTITVVVDALGNVTSSTGGTVEIDHVHQIILLDPTFDLDFSNNYTLDVSLGAFTGVGTHQTSVAFSPVSFSTVSLGSTLASSQKMSEINGGLVPSYNWVSANQSDPNSQIKGIDVGSDSVAVVLGLNPNGSDGQGGGFFNAFNGFVSLQGFTANDLIYVDNMGNNALTAMSDQVGNHSWTANTDSEGNQSDTVMFDGTEFGARIALNGSGSVYSDADFDQAFGPKHLVIG